MAFTNLLKLSNIFLPHNDHGKLHFSPHIFCFVFYSEDALSRIWIQYVNDLISFMSKIKQMLECVFPYYLKFHSQSKYSNKLTNFSKIVFCIFSIIPKFLFLNLEAAWKFLFLHKLYKCFSLRCYFFKNRSFWDT